MNWFVSKPHFVLQISWPLKIAQKLFCIQNLHLDLSFREIKVFENPLLNCRDIKQTPSFILFWTPNKDFHFGSPLNFLSQTRRKYQEEQARTELCKAQPSLSKIYTLDFWVGGWACQHYIFCVIWQIIVTHNCLDKTTQVLRVKILLGCCILCSGDYSVSRTIQSVRNNKCWLVCMLS